MKGLFFLFAFLATWIGSAGAQPELFVAGSQKNVIEISWAASDLDLQLEQAAALGPVSIWEPVLSGVVQDAGQSLVQIIPAETAQFFRLRMPDFFRIEWASPYDGEKDVAVTRESIFHFSAPLAKDTVLNSETFYAVAAGRKILSRAEISGDRKQAALFYLEPLPGSAQVQVFLNPDELLDENGRSLDPMVPADGRVLSYETLALAPLEKTAVIGTVYASELGNGTNKPLAGVTVTVDGMEQTIRAVTDANGNFKLSPVPPGRFFVHIDGRTVTNEVLGIHYPDRAYYPFVGKAWESVAGREDNPAGETGKIYLPLIAPDTLQTVSQTANTTVSFPASVVAANPGLAGVTVTVPPNSLFNDNGTRGGKVGIAPVPPDRLPGPLPPGVQLPLVITVQTDGALNFDQPAPVCFPNLPDPVLGKPLEPGSKQSLISFNHKKGNWEAVGSMTVSADGKLICSDPGSGIVQPGWHGVAPPPVGPQPPCSSCCPFGGGPQPLAVQSFRAQTTEIRPASFSDSRGDISALGKPKPKPRPKPKKPTRPSRPPRKPEPMPAVNCAPNPHPLPPPPPPPKTPCERQNDDYYSCVDNCKEDAQGEEEGARARLGEALGPCLGKKGAQRMNCIFFAMRDYDADVARIKKALAACIKQCDSDYPPCTEPAAQPLSHALAVGNLDDILDTLVDLTDQLDAITAPYITPDETPWPAEIDTQVDAILEQMTTVGGPDFARLLHENALAFNEADTQQLALDYYGLNNAPPYPVLYVAEIQRPSGMFYLRGQTGPYGQYSLFIPRDGQLLQVRFYDPQTKSYGVVQPVPDYPFLPDFTLFYVTEKFLDADKDGVPDLVELVYGTDPYNADSDADGVPDGAEIEQGTSPLNGQVVSTGVIAATKTPGAPIDIATGNGLLATAEGTAGVSILAPFNGNNPIILSHIAVAGSAQRVVIDGNFVAAAGVGGLFVLDISQPSNPRIAFQKALGTAQAVAANSDVAYVGFGSGIVVAVDMLHQTTGAAVSLNGPVQDLQVLGDYLYALTGDRLYVLSLGLRGMSIIGSTPSPYTAAPNQRLFVADNVAYTVHRTGYNTIDVTDPAKPALIKAGNTAQFGWKQIVANGSGLGLAATGLNSTDEGPHDISLYDLSSPAKTDVVITTFPTPGHATATAILNGLAYIADREAGVEVINYLPYDSKHVAPAIHLNNSFAPAGIEEGKRGRVTASVSDDVQVRNVAFYIDGVVQFVDGTYPFELAFTAPARVQGKTSFTVRALATDTGGNSTWSEELTVPLLPDVTPPTILSTDPITRAALVPETAGAITAYFSEPMNPNFFGASSFQVFSAGPDGVLGTSDDQPMTGTLSYNADLWTASFTLAQTPAQGHYRATVSSARDLAGNLLAQPLTVDFAVVKNYMIVYGRSDGTNGTIWLATSDGSYDQQITTGFQPRLSPDGRMIAFRRAGRPSDVNTANIYLRDLVSGSETLLHTYGGGILNSYDWRASGKSIIYDESGSILQLAVDGSSAPQNLLQGADAWDDGPAANPVNDGFVVWNQRPGNPDAGLHIADAGGSGRTLVPGSGVNDAWAAWSPDGSSISFARLGQDNGYYRIRPDGSDLVRITTGFELVNSPANSPAIWAPDRKTLYAPLGTNGVQQLYAIPASGQGVPVRVPVHDGDPVIWVGSVQVTPFEIAGSSPQGDRIYPIRYLSEVTVQFSHPLDIGTLNQQTFHVIGAGADGQFNTADDQTIPGTVQPSSNGYEARWIPAAELPEGKYRTEVLGSVKDIAGTTLGASYTWSFEVKKVGFLIGYGRTGANDGTVWLTSEDGSLDQQITSGERPRLSPDGRYMLFMRGAGTANYARGNLYLRDLLAGTEALKFNVGGDYTVGYDWQNGTNNIVFDYNCFIEAFVTDQQNQVIVRGNCVDDAPVANPVDNRLAFHSDRGLFLAAANGAGRVQIPNTQAGDYWPQWSPDGEWISFYRSASTNIFKIRADGSELTQLTKLSGDGKNSFVNAPAPWSPDGTGLYSVGVINGVQAIYLIDAEGIVAPKPIKISTAGDLDVVTSVIIAPTGFTPK